MIEVGFIKGTSYYPDKTLFADISSFKSVLLKKNPKVPYVGMLDMSTSVSKESITPRDMDCIGGIRVIFKKERN